MPKVALKRPAAAEQEAEGSESNCSAAHAPDAHARKRPPPKRQRERAEPEAKPKAKRSAQDPKILNCQPCDEDDLLTQHAKEFVSKLQAADKKKLRANVQVVPNRAAACALPWLAQHRVKRQMPESVSAACALSTFAEQRCNCSST